MGTRPGADNSGTNSGMAIYLHHDDLPDGIELGREIAIDTETMGLNPHRDRLCLVQLSSGDGDAHLVKMAHPLQPAPNLAAVLANPAATKLFHFARFDLAALAQSVGPIKGPIYCTKIASRLCRTYTDRHGLKDLCAELIGVEISKQQQSSDWGADTLSDAQQKYAASDVLYLHRLRAVLDEMLVREGRADIARACFEFLPVRAGMDLGGFADLDIFHH